MVTVERDRLRVALSRGERWATLRRTDVTVPLGAISAVEPVAEPYRLVRGWRAPGLAVPGRTRIGTWRTRGRKTFVNARKGEPGLRITLLGGHAAAGGFDQLLLSFSDTAAMTRVLNELLRELGPGGRFLPSGERLLTFRSGDVELAGTLCLPTAGGPPRAAAVLVNGSGKLDRDGDDRRAPLGVSRQLADALANSGIQSLRYDKRGVGASGGDFLHAGFTDNIDDARSAVHALRDQPDCAGVPLFVIGHSEGALIATALAAESGAPLSGVVLLSGPAKTGEQALLWQAERIAPTLPRPVRAVLRLLRTDPVRQQRKTLDRLGASTGDVARMQGVKVNAKWFRELLGYDPVPHLRAIRIPVLAVTGEKDLQVDPADLDVIAASVAGPVTIDRVPELSHILRRDPDEPSLGHYRKLLAEPVDPAVLQTVSGWIRQTADDDGRPGS